MLPNFVFLPQTKSAVKSVNGFVTVKSAVRGFYKLIIVKVNLSKNQSRNFSLIFNRLQIDCTVQTIEFSSNFSSFLRVVILYEKLFILNFIIYLQYTIV